MNKIPIAHITPMRPWWANDQDVARLQTKTVPKNLIWSESAQWLRSYSVRKISGALITPMGVPIMPPWANHHYVAHLQAMTVPTWFGVNRLSGYKVTASAIFQSPLLQIPGALITPMDMPMWPQRASGRDVAHLEAETVPIDLIWSESAQWLLSYRPDQRADRRTDRRVDWRWGGGHSIIHLFPSERAGDKNIHLVLQTGKYFFYCKSHSLRSIIIKSRCWRHDEYFWHNFFNINITLCCLIR